ncbi:Tpr-related protein family member, putative [Theileria annulata]|uniref:Tpr-related protein family member, putative n=1 Tax=Theileria annulata TaxID=5874 RepID=Q4UAF4_THEAN|nr:Tpr-related protein family member, putative [Theileria annulata]CAI76197.1 Tpr-related protein family member, putative [Theileria annulata]|eukprot:XP_952822.1 Tpr-related protein family member, putative [Theileria annulata]
MAFTSWVAFCLRLSYIGCIVNCLGTSDVTLKHERLEEHLTNTRDYDIQSNNVPPELQTKATQLKDKAGALKTKAQGAGATNVGAAAGTLRDKASDLNRDASNIKEGELEELKQLATNLATAAKGDDGGDETSLYKTAEALSSTQDYGRAIAVIVAFGKVKAAYQKLAAHPKYKEYKQKLEAAQLSSRSDSPEAKVKAVEDAWTQVNTQFQALCMALIKHFAGQIDTAAGQLAGSGGTQTHANNVITSFEVVEMAYNELNDKLTVKSEFEALKLIYNQMLNLNKLHKAVEKLRAAAQAASATALQQAADTLKDNVTNLRDKTDNEAHVNAKNVKDKFNEVKNAFNKLGTAQTTVKQDWEDLKAVYDNIGFCYKDVKFYSIIVPCIFSMSSDLSPSTKYVWHGNKRTNNGFHGWTEYKDHQGKANDESGEAAECPDPSGQPQTYKHVPVHA